MKTYAHARKPWFGELTGPNGIAALRIVDGMHASQSPRGAVGWWSGRGREGHPGHHSYTSLRRTGTLAPEPDG